jgi:hypothetical protein
MKGDGQSCRSLLVALGVDLIVVVAFAGLVFGRRRWLKRQPREFAGAIRVSSGDVDGLSPKWKRGSGRWVREVLVWRAAPLMLRNEPVPVDRLSEERQARDGKVKRLGDKPVVIEFVSGAGKIDVAARARDRPGVRALDGGRAAHADGDCTGVSEPRHLDTRPPVPRGRRTLG